MHGERQHLRDAERILREHAHEQHHCTDDDSGCDGGTGTADRNCDDDQRDTDGVVGDRVEPSGEKAYERHGRAPSLPTTSVGRARVRSRASIRMTCMSTTRADDLFAPLVSWNQLSLRSMINGA